VATARAHADRLEARRPDSIEFSGNFRLEGFDQRKTPWKLVADRARIDGMGVAGRGLLEGVQASGAIEFALGDALHAVGEEFSVRTTQRRIRIAGDPARVEYEGMVFTSTWVEYDLLIHLLRAGKTVIEPDEL
jgi:hypothetical protein